MYDLYTKSRASLNGRRCDANVMERNTNDMRNIQALVLALIRWCGREDLNLHTLTGTCTSSMRVRQFRHDRKIELLALARTPYLKLMRLPTAAGRW